MSPAKTSSARLMGCLCRFALLGWLALAAPPVRAQDNLEYQVKGAFLAKFAPFVEWPAQCFTNAKAPVVIGIFGHDPLGAAFEQAVRLQTANGRHFEIRRLQTPADVQGCHILFITATGMERWAELRTVLGTSPVLTVGEAGQFAAQGGVVNFYKEEGKVRFEINVDAAARANLKISAKLLQLSRIIHDPPPDGAGK